ncbi:MAG: YdeI/OmpD-associated family protein [bacterium]
MITEKTLNVPTRAAWRKWLQKHHRSEMEIWLVFYKKHTQMPTISYNESVEEALCFGWIDSIKQRLDDDRYVYKFTPRRKGSVWSESNKRRVQLLIKEGRMAQAGLALVQQAKEDGSWNNIPASRIKHTLAPVLQRLLESHKQAFEFFNGLSLSQKTMYLGWIMSAKKEETQCKRMKEAISLLARRMKLGMK